MKTRLLSMALILILSVPFTMAQDPVKTSFGILGGVNFQNFNGKNNSGDMLENDMIIGYHAGFNIQIPLAPQFYFQPGLLFSTKGSEKSFGSFTGTYKLSYIELPLNLVYKGLLGTGYVFIGFGPYAAYGIMGKSELEVGSATIESDIEFKDVLESGDPLTTPYFNPLDAGANIFFGYEMAGGIFVQLNAQLGLLKINPEDNRDIVVYSDELSVKNTGFGVSLGYRF